MRAFSRRQFLQCASATGVLSLPASPSFSKISLGRASLTTISDGHLVLPLDIAIGDNPKSEATEILRKHGISENEVRPSCNVSIYQDDTNTVLFDVGSGPDFMPSAGTLLENLSAIGIAPEDVTHVLITHAHPDHLWGLLDDFDEPVFTNATHLIGRKEWDYWWDPDTLYSVGQTRMTFAAGARRRFEIMEDVIERFDDGQEVASGIAAVATYGHTPGHMSFEVRSGNQASLIIGDAIANHHLAFQRPDWPSGSDQNPDLGIQTRLALFDRIGADDLSVVGFHFPGTGFGRIEKMSSGYQFIEETI